MEDTQALIEKERKIFQTDPRLIQATQEDILQIFGGSKAGQYRDFVLAALSGIPWVGILSAVAGFKAEERQDKLNQLIGLWLHEHKGKFVELGQTIDEILTRLDGFGQEIKDRIESSEYLALVRKAFKSWDQADTYEKRQMLKKLLMNAGGTKLCPDDLVRLFISWIDQYHEAHFMVIREIYQHKGITRWQIWKNIHGEQPREDSAEASLFRYLIGELSMGRIIHQEREVNDFGQYMRKSTRGQHRGPASSVMESAFEDAKPYELSELGERFVHYVMDDLVPRIENQNP